MTTNEFIRVLGESLQNSMPIGEVRENVQYYKDYIAEEMRKGRSEESVLAELGDPRLIARTILDAKGYSGSFRGDSFNSSYENSESYRSYHEAGQSSYREPFDSGYASGVHVKRFDKWYHKLIFLLIIVLVLVVGFTLVAGVVSLLLHFAVPILLIYLVIRAIRAILQG